MEFEKLLTQITDNELLDKIIELLNRKKSGMELGAAGKIVVINNFIEKTLQHFEQMINTFDPQKNLKQESLEEGFIKILENMDKNPSQPLICNEF